MTDAAPYNPYYRDSDTAPASGVPLLLALSRADLVDALDMQAAELERRARNLPPNTHDPVGQRRLMTLRVDRLRAAATVLAHTPDHRNVATMATPDLVEEARTRAAAMTSGRMTAGEMAAAAVPLAAVATEAAGRLAALTGPLDHGDAVALTEIVRAAQSGKQVGRRREDGTTTTARATGIVVDRDQDVRTGTLRVTDDQRAEHWPIRDLIAEYNRGDFVPSYDPAAADATD